MAPNCRATLRFPRGVLVVQPDYCARKPCALAHIVRLTTLSSAAPQGCWAAATFSAQILLLASR